MSSGSLRSGVTGTRAPVLLGAPTHTSLPTSVPVEFELAVSFAPSTSSPAATPEHTTGAFTIPLSNAAVSFTASTFTPAPTRTAASFAVVLASLGVALAACTFTPAGSPGISGITGTIGHNNSVVINGFGLGNKTADTDFIFDRASGTRDSILSNYTGVWPSTTGTVDVWTRYRTPAEVVTAKANVGASGGAPSFPHARATKFICGSNWSNANSPYGGANVSFWRTFDRPAYPFKSYASFYHRYDDNWKFGLGSGDDNIKFWGVSNRSDTIIPGNYNWYVEWNPRPTSTTSSCAYHLIADNEFTLDGSKFLDWWFGNSINPMSGVWAKVEVRVLYTDQDDGTGLVQVIENGVSKGIFSGYTDKLPTLVRSLGYCGYARSTHVDNWRYIVDFYQQAGVHGWMRVVLGNAPTYAASGTREMQEPNGSWTDTAIPIKMNFGAFTTGQTCYMYAIDNNNNVIGGDIGFAIVAP